MQFRLISLVLFVTVAAVYFALIGYGPEALIVLGIPFTMVLWQLIQLGRELNRQE
jgi:hypothetical protein